MTERLEVPNRHAGTATARSCAGIVSAVARLWLTVDRRHALLRWMKMQRFVDVVMSGMGLGIVYSLAEAVFVAHTWQLKVMSAGGAVLVASLLTRVVVLKVCSRS